MDALRKPQRAFKKFVSKVSIQTVMVNGSDEEDAQPLSISRARDEWPLPRSVDLKDPKVWFRLLNFNFVLCQLYSSDIEKMLTRAELASLEEGPRIRFPAGLDCRRWNPENTVRHYEQCHRGSV
jgi:hypothetical protein